MKNKWNQNDDDQDLMYIFGIARLDWLSQSEYNSYYFHAKNFCNKYYLKYLLQNRRKGRLSCTLELCKMFTNNKVPSIGHVLRVSGRFTEVMHNAHTVRVPKDYEQATHCYGRLTIRQPSPERLYCFYCYFYCSTRTFHILIIWNVLVILH